MKLLHTLSDAAYDTYRSELTHEKLGWIIFKNDRSFVPVYRVLMHPEDGPVVMILDEVWEVDCDGPVFADEDAARDAYYAAKPALKE